MKSGFNLGTVAGELLYTIFENTKFSGYDYGLAYFTERIPAKPSRHPGAVAHRKWKTRRASGKR